MFPFIVLFFQIAIFRKGPQDVPPSGLLLNIVVVIFVCVHILILSLNQVWPIALLQTAVEFLLIVVFSWPLLYFSGKLARFPQTFCALLGVDSVISFFAVPAFTSQNGLIILLLLIWHWAVSGNIYRYALDKPLSFGLGLVLLYRLISSQVIALLFPVISMQS
ncbi:MAG: hypothetical protein ABSB19_12500 [Methylomonas sp.]|jgi:hypothetical protein